MKKIHWYEIKFYSTGGWLKTVNVNASSKGEALDIVRKNYQVIEMYSIRFID